MKVSSPNKSKSHPILHDEIEIQQQWRAARRSLSWIGVSDPSLIEFMEITTKRFLIQFANAHRRLAKKKSIEEFLDSCKRRYRELQLLVQSAITADQEGLDLSVQRQMPDGTVRTFKYKYENRLQIIQKDDPDVVVFMQSIKPKAYTALFRAAYSLVAELDQLDRDFDMEARDQVTRCLLVLLTLGKIYDNLRGSDDYIKGKIEDSIRHMTTVPSLGACYKDLRLTMAEICRQRDSRHRVPKYLYDLVAALRQVDMSEYDPDEDAYISFRSSGTRWRNPKSGKTETIPALFAALVEVPIDIPKESLIGYHHTTVDLGLNPYNIQSRGPHTRVVPQAKTAPRVIQLAPNQLQDIANWFHNRLDKVCRSLRSDCTHDQERGVTFIKNALSPESREHGNISVYTEDISDATGTINPTFQRDVLAMVFGDELADFYMELASAYPKVFVDFRVGEIEYIQTNGQPQGWKGSFPGFALAHHVIFLTTMRLRDLLETPAHLVYRVLGDDSAAAVYDPEYRFRDCYKELCHSIGWVVNDKGYEFNPHDHKTKPIAEFAKVTVIGGQVFTPIPLRTFFNCGETITRTIQFFAWVALRVREVTFEEVMDAIRTVDDKRIPSMEDFIAYLTTVRRMRLSETLNTFSCGETEDDVNPKDRVVTALSVLRSEVRASLYSEFLPDHLREEEVIDSKVLIDPSICQTYEEHLVPFCKDPNNKFFWVRRRNEVLIEALNEIFDTEAPGLGIACMALGITSEDYSAVFQVSEILQSDPQLYLESERYLEICNTLALWRSVTKGKTLRSWVKQRHREAVMLLSAYKDSIPIWRSTGWYEDQTC